MEINVQEKEPSPVAGGGSFRMENIFLRVAQTTFFNIILDIT
jgi:hypothetical protein